MLLGCLTMTARVDADPGFSLAYLEPRLLKELGYEEGLPEIPLQRQAPRIFLNWVDEAQAEWSEDIVELAAYIDSLMGAVDTEQDLNKSYLKIYLTYYHTRYGEVKFDPRVRFSLDLPVMEEKLRLVFETEPDQAKELGERKLETFPRTPVSETDGNIYASFRLLINADKWSTLSFDNGVRVRVRPDIFSRARGVRSWALTEDWLFRYSQEFFWFESRGLGTHTKFDFDRTMGPQWLFRKTMALNWSERRARYDLLNQFSLYQTLSENRALHYSIGFQADQQKSQWLSGNYYIQTVFRSRLYKDWLYYQINTGIEWPREHAFKADPFIGLRLEMLFAEDADKRLQAMLH